MYFFDVSFDPFDHFLSSSAATLASCAACFDAAASAFCAVCQLFSGRLAVAIAGACSRVGLVWTYASVAGGFLGVFTSCFFAAHFA